ncbi:MAG: hypothetical protein ABI604_08790, partial [Nitrospirota bacterium]
PGHGVDAIAQGGAGRVAGTECENQDRRGRSRIESGVEAPGRLLAYFFSILLEASLINSPSIP